MAFFAASVILLPGESPSRTKAVLFRAIGLGEEKKLSAGNRSVNSWVAGLAVAIGQPGWEVRRGDRLASGERMTRENEERYLLEMVG